MTFQETLNAAIADILLHGFDSPDRLGNWMEKIETAARASLVSEVKLQMSVAAMLKRVYGRELKSIERNPLLLSQFTIAKIRPKLRDELDRKIIASYSLIKLNRDASIQRTKQRFAAWATSIPKGGTKIEDRKEIRKSVRRGIAGLPFEERRVIIDQGHKLAAAISEIVAKDGGAIAGVWEHVHRGPPSYQSRPEHVARSGHVFLLRESWAKDAGFVRPGKDGYTDDVEQPGEYISCSCKWRWIYALRDLPPEMLTVKGKEALLAARAKLRRVANA